MSLWVHRYSIFTFYDNFKRKIQKREEHTIDLVLSGRVAIGGGTSSSSSSGVDGPVEFSCLDGCCCKRIIKYLNIFADQYWYKVFFNFSLNYRHLLTSPFKRRINVIPINFNLVLNFILAKFRFIWLFNFLRRRRIKF